VNGTQTFNNSINTTNLSLGQHTLWFGADTWSSVGEGDETNNFNSFTFTVAAGRDLVVSSVAPAATTVALGASLGFSYSIKDVGGLAAGASYAAFMIDQKPTTANYAGWNYVDALAAGASQTFISSISTAGLSVGQHTLWFGADTWSSVAETDETNNFNSFTFNVVAMPDLVVSAVTPVATTVAQGASLGFSYTIKDIGAASTRYRSAPTPGAASAKATKPTTSTPSPSTSWRP